MKERQRIRKFIESTSGRPKTRASMIAPTISKTLAIRILVMIASEIATMSSTHPAPKMFTKAAAPMNAQAAPKVDLVITTMTTSEVVKEGDTMMNTLTALLAALMIRMVRNEPWSRTKVPSVVPLLINRPRAHQQDTRRLGGHAVRKRSNDGYWKVMPLMTLNALA